MNVTASRCEVCALFVLPYRARRFAESFFKIVGGRRATVYDRTQAGAAYWLAVFTVNQVIDTWAAVRSRPNGSAGFVVRGSYSRRLALNFVRCGLGLALYAAGAALGSMLHPRHGTNVGIMVAPALVPLLV